MRWLLSILLAWPVALFAANGDITGVAIETNGWQALVYVSGMATNGTFAFGLGANNSIVGTEKLRITLTSPGYDDTGATTTVQRVVYGTKQVRLPYPNQTYSDTALPGDGTVKLRIALSDYVFASDASITADIASNLYNTNSITSAAAVGVTVTNMSTQVYWKSFANWTWPGNQLIRGNSMTLRAIGFHWSGQNFRPLRAMKFIVTGATSGTAVSNIVTQMTIDRTVPDRILTGEYVTTFDVSGMTQNELMRCDLIAYPWVGDSASLVDTTLNAYAWTTSYPHSITNRCDKGNTYGHVIAVVDAAGNDTNGRSTVNSDPTAVNSAQYFLTIGKAASQIAATNNLVYSHNDLEGGTIYVRSGINTWTGSSGSYGNAPRTWIDIKPYPGDTVAFTSQSADKSFGTGSMARLFNIGFTSGNLFFDGHVWMDQCAIGYSGAALVSGQKSWWVTDCTVPQLSMGFIPSGGDYAVNLVRGCNLTGFTNGIFGAVVMGNSHPTTDGSYYFTVGADYAPTRVSDGAMIYNNDFRGFNGTGLTALGSGVSATISNGVAIIQNIFEFCSSDSSAQMSVGANNANQMTNALMVNNVFVGTKLNQFYNDSGSAISYKVGNHVIGSLVDDYNIKTDVFTTANANRVGNWSAMWGVGYRNNVFPETDGVGGAGSNPPEFTGIRCIGPSSNASADVSTNRVTYMQFVDREAWGYGASSPTPGGGNYRTRAGAPQLSIAGVDFLPFDLEGNNRGLSDPPGAYASASPRKGAGFFAP